MPRKLTLLDPEQQDFIEDDEGNQYTHDEVRAAVERMTADEAGEGSLGGLAEDDEGDYLQTDETTPPFAPARGPFAPSTGAERELNPLNFGDFFKSNIFGGLDARYVTGKRPMTAFDLGTDALIAYSGGDIAGRNAKLIATDIARSKEAREGRLTEQRLRTGKAQERKAGLETEKLAGEAIERIMYDLDSDLWGTEMKALVKQHGLELRPGTLQMTERMASMLAEAGAKSPGEVLENPDRFDPALVNRVRHTMRLLTKSFEESENRRLQGERDKQALGLRPGEEQRKREEFDQETTGVDDAIDIVAQSEMPKEQRAGLIAALRAGGTPRDEALKRIAGLGSEASKFGVEYRGLLQQAEEELRAGGKTAPTPGEINAKAQELKIRYAGERKQKVDVTGQAQKGIKATTDAFNQLNTIKDAVGRVGLTGSALAAWTTQPISVWLRRAGKSTALAALDSIDAVMGQIARSVSGEVGVLTNPDIERIRVAVKPNLGIGGDTAQTYAARLGFVEEIMRRAKIAHERALETGQYEPVDASDLTFPGDPFPNERGLQPGAPGGAAGATNDRKAAAEAIRAERDPARKRAMARDFANRFPRQ